MATILIIEDDVNLAELIKDRLEEHGYHGIVAYTGVKGLESITKESPDIITLDIHLPDISGLEILKSLRRSKSPLPVIVISADETMQKECESYNVNEFMRKPVDFKKLKEIVDSATKK